MGTPRYLLCLLRTVKMDKNCTNSGEIMDLLINHS
ncbi:MAG: hypothetical protein ACI9S7_001111, partial [Candidatus Paceibacteria bacterium]